jgi:hypothetical protein
LQCLKQNTYGKWKVKPSIIIISVPENQKL